MKVLFVCHGNINRSAAGEIIAKQNYPNLEVKSAALKETKGGELTTKKMRTALQELGYNTEGIRSNPISLDLIEWADIVFYMDNSNQKKLYEFFPDYIKKFKRISSFIGIPKIPDPNFSPGIEEHKKVVKMIERALEVFNES